MDERPNDQLPRLSVKNYERALLLVAPCQGEKLSGTTLPSQTARTP